MKLELKTNGKTEIYYIEIMTLLKNNRYVTFLLDPKDKRYGQKLQNEMFTNQLTVDILKSSFEIYKEN